MGIQEFKKSLMSAGKKTSQLQKRWGNIRVLVIEEISMVSAVLYNMLDYRSMLGRSAAFNVDPLTYTKVGCVFGRVPIVLHLGDFLQLSRTAQISLIEDPHRRDDSGPTDSQAGCFGSTTCTKGFQADTRCFRVAGYHAFQAPGSSH